MKKRLGIISLILLTLIVVLFAARHRMLQPQAAVRIAANLPLTGPMAASTGAYPNGFRMGLEDAEIANGVDPKSISADFQDNAGVANNSISVLLNQRLNKPTIYISGTSEAAIAVAKQVDSMDIPSFIVAFDPFLTSEGKNRLRIWPNAKIEGGLFVHDAVLRHAKKVFIMNLNSAYANSEVDEVIGPDLRSHGIDYQREQFEFGLRDFKSLALKAKGYGPDLIFTIGYSVQLKPLLRDLRTAGLVHGGSVMAAMDFVDMLHDGTPEGELTDVDFACPNFEIKDETGKAEAWRQRYQGRFGSMPTYAEAYAYDTAAIITKSSKLDVSLTLQSIRSILPYEGITGSINLDKNGDITATVSTAMVNASGNPVPASHAGAQL